MNYKKVLTAQEIEELFPMIDPPPSSSEESVNILANFNEWSTRAKVADSVQLLLDLANSPVGRDEAETLGNQSDLAFETLVRQRLAAIAEEVDPAKYPPKPAHWPEEDEHVSDFAVTIKDAGEFVQIFGKYARFTLLNAQDYLDSPEANALWGDGETLH